MLSGRLGERGDDAVHVSTCRTAHTAGRTYVGRSYVGGAYLGRRRVVDDLRAGVGQDGSSGRDAALEHGGEGCGVLVVAGHTSQLRKDGPGPLGALVPDAGQSVDDQPLRATDRTGHLGGRGQGPRGDGVLGGQGGAGEDLDEGHVIGLPRYPLHERGGLAGRGEPAGRRVDGQAERAGVGLQRGDEVAG